MKLFIRKKVYFIFIIVFTVYLIYTNFPNSAKSFNTSMLSSVQSMDFILNSTTVLLPQINVSSKTKYLVNTEFCQMIDWPVFDNETRPLFHNRSGKRIKCRSHETQVISVRRVNQTIVKIDYLRKTQPIPKCYVSQVYRRRGYDSKVKFSKETGPVLGSIDMKDSDAVRVRCYQTKQKSLKSAKVKKYFRYKVFEQIVPLIPEKSLKTKNYRTVVQNIPNVLMLGIDSISWLNFKRQFSFTKSLAEKQQFYPIYGYNKIGDNTFPNLMAILTGQFYDIYWNESVRKSKHFDDVPIVWKEFSERNLLTAFIEDLPRWSLFNFNKLGFIEQPTDYYLRPVSLGIENQLKRFCYKDKMEIEFYYNYTYDLINAMRIREQKYFGFIFMAHLTHNDANYAGYADLPVYSLLTKLFDNNLMDDTILFLFSDHGIRFGSIRATASGTIEERLPFVYIYLPKTFKTETIHKNLVINSGRLTTPFDIHATLLHIATGKSDTNQSNGKSLFDEIPYNRSCDSEQISQHWCVCNQQNRVDSQQDVSTLSEFVVSEVNQLLKPVSKYCVDLVLNKQLSAFVSVNDSSIDFQKFYTIRVEVVPSFAIFEATVRQVFEKLTIIGDISRINEYGNQSVCINNSFLQKYCSCKLK